MTDEQRDHDSARAPSGTGAGGTTDRPIPADRAAGRTAGASTGENTPEDGATPGDIDGDALRFGDGVAGVDDSAATRDPASGADGSVEGSESSAEQAAADADQASEDVAEATAEVEAEPVVEEEPDWKDRYVRSVAELDNVRKRARRDAAQGEARGIAKLAKELLPALDNLDRALAHVDGGPTSPGDPDGPSESDGQLVEGLRIVHREIHAALSAAGIEAFDPLGEPFDPHAHEALTQQPAPEGTAPGTITAVYQAGYRRGDDVLRAAKVVVAG